MSVIDLKQGVARCTCPDYPTSDDKHSPFLDTKAPQCPPQTLLGTRSTAFSNTRKAEYSGLLAPRYICSWRAMGMASVVFLPGTKPNCTLSIPPPCESRNLVLVPAGSRLRLNTGDHERCLGWGVSWAHIGSLSFAIQLNIEHGA